MQPYPHHHLPAPCSDEDYDNDYIHDSRKIPPLYLRVNRIESNPESIKRLNRRYIELKTNPEKALTQIQKYEKIPAKTSRLCEKIFNSLEFRHFLQELIWQSKNDNFAIEYLGIKYPHAMFEFAIERFCEEIQHAIRDGRIHSNFYLCFYPISTSRKEDFYFDCSFNPLVYSEIADSAAPSFFIYLTADEIQKFDFGKAPKAATSS